MKKQNYMEIALKLAKKAAINGDVPIGAIIVDENDNIIGRGFNKKEKDKDPTQHAEIIAIKKACKKNNNWRLLNCTIYTTLEPCLMCVGALLQTRIKHIVFALKDSKFGCVESLYSLTLDKRFNHRSEYTYSLNLDSKEMLQSFFGEIRNL
ncbi:nucleoside deaminase [Spiroplasma ixodetis]|uniref:nucleoside deaminase n=1 Tax=Spiroplasma ixodetis TaxID=2141 RepID=UPI0025787CD9|nr:nucleoside deaminase [Spiroplasma ixodetis]WJG69196.1 tRNA-specific adenosine deaminase [Spiroplasma ixodetis Y32]